MTGSHTPSIHSSPSAHGQSIRQLLQFSPGSQTALPHNVSGGTVVVVMDAGIVIVVVEIVVGTVVMVVVVVVMVTLLPPLL